MIFCLFIDLFVIKTFLWQKLKILLVSNNWTVLVMRKVLSMKKFEQMIIRLKMYIIFLFDDKIGMLNKLKINYSGE